MVKYRGIYRGGFCPKCNCEPCVCKPLELDKKLIINQITPDGAVVELVAEMMKRKTEISTHCKKMKIPEQDKFIIGNKRRESLKFYYHQGKPYLALFVNAGIHTSSFFLGAEGLENLENFLHKKRKDILLNIRKPKDKEMI